MEPFFDSYKPNRVIPPEGLDRLLALGWYRMHQHIFTCSHVNLNGIYQVHWLRFAVDGIQNNQTHKRIRKRNANFTFAIEDFDPNSVRLDHQILHARYRASIDFDGANSIEECLLGDDYAGLNIFHTKCISIFHENRLIAGGYFDVGRESAASILHFFDPSYKKHSLGKFLILLTLDYLRQHNIKWYYPGYIVEGNPKMDYKLFVGEHAEYFVPDTIRWENFEPALISKPAKSETKPIQI